MDRRTFLATASAAALPLGTTRADDHDDLRASVGWLESRTRTLLQGCRRTAHDGTTLFTPDGRGYYPALWTRDFSYMVENAGGLIDPKEVDAAIAYLLRGLRADGAPPDRVQIDGLPVYVAGPTGQPLGEPNLDDAAFLVLLADEHLRTLPPAAASARFDAWRGDLERTMRWVPRSPQGLVWNDPAKPHSPYGFTDNVGKTGELFFESLLDWTASRRFAARLRAAGRDDDAKPWDAAAARIEDNLGALRDDASGVFFAATRDCRQLDVWGNAFALALGFPLGKDADRIRRWLVDNLDEITWQGQVRHLPKGQYWTRLLSAVPPDRYQNGAYWATATGWLMEAIAPIDPDRARRLFADLVAFFRREGEFECVHPDGYRKLDTYVASACNPLGAAHRLGW